jgi:RNA polymerase sigma factor (sigma-70 family)
MAVVTSNPPSMDTDRWYPHARYLRAPATNSRSGAGAEGVAMGALPGSRLPRRFLTRRASAPSVAVSRGRNLTMDTPLANELRQHTAALRALARSLVGESAAEDLVQDVALAVLEQPPPVATGLRAFLQTMLRRRAKNHWRATQRRRWREQHSASPESASSPVSLVEQQEAVKLATDSLLALPEPYRDVLFRRFFRDALPGDIARETGVPLATIKSQLQRGLAMLRERLDRDGRSDWQRALGAACGLDRLCLVPDSIGVGGAFAMGIGMKVVAAGFVVAACYWLWQPFDPVAHLPGEPPGGGVAALAMSAAAPADGPVATAARSAVPPAAERAADRVPSVTGRAVDEQRRPLAGIRVTMQTVVADEVRYLWERRHGAFLAAANATVTGEDGGFTFAVSAGPARRFDLELRSDDRVAAEGVLHFDEGQGAVDVGDVVLPRGRRVLGRLLDRKHRPQAACTVMLDRDGGTGTVAPLAASNAVTGPDGTFAIDDPLPGDSYEVSPTAAIRLMARRCSGQRLSTPRWNRTCMPTSGKLPCSPPADRCSRADRGAAPVRTRRRGAASRSRTGPAPG